ncbi:glycosyl hydrolase catalytic core-domain-containing protein [Bisporella sp. PMI_857]|nr:glycosyl hydrolase catalytic core-domain-containing protein [Bisporella sp. PMI_857]
MRLSTYMSASTPSRLLLLPLSLASFSFAAGQLESKRGISVLGDDHNSDWSLLTSTESPLSWYWNWSPWPTDSKLVAGLMFVPQIHGIDNIEANAAQVNRLPENSTHLLTFNEPDGTTDSGGSSISPQDAAKTYIDSIVSLRKANGGRYLISHPASTGSAPGLNWLREFNASCYDLEPETGCPLDFIAAHWYGAFDGLTWWVSQLDTFYNVNTTRETPLKIWITEVALPQADEDATVQMLNQTIPYLDAAEDVEAYAWFGMFRRDESNEWTGKEVAMFKSDGALTEVGATYLNGVASNETSKGLPFEEGQKGDAKDENSASRFAPEMWLLLGMSLWWALLLSN